MPLTRDRKAGKGRGRDWVRDRKKFGAGPPVQYPFSRDKESAVPDLPDEEVLPEPPGEEVLPDLPDVEALPEPPDEEVLPEPPDGEALPEPPDEEVLPEPPDGEALPEPADEEILPEPAADIPAGRSETVPAEVPDVTDGSASPDPGEDGIVPSDAPEENEENLRSRARRFMTRKRRETVRMVIRTVVVGFFALLFLMPIFLTITNSFMTSSEISANYGMIFAKNSGVRVFISRTVNLKFIPDIISFGQYFKVLFLSPEYLMKFWNSFFYVVPIVIFQLGVASLASYGFARYRGRVREAVFFSYIILMLMPYQVTLVPNFLVSSWLNIIDTRWAILLPGFFSPFAVYMLTKYMRRIPQSIYEAAEIDGAGEWQIFTGVCLPNCRGGLVSIAILIFIDYWNMVEQPLILLSDDQLHPLSVFLSRINDREISLAFAVAVIYMVLPMMVFLYGEDYLVEGIIYQGGIKE